MIFNKSHMTEIYRFKNISHKFWLNPKFKAMKKKIKIGIGRLKKIDV